MINFSRRQLAKYAVNQMLAGQSTASLAKQLAAALLAARRQREAELFLADIDQEMEDRGLLAKARVTTAQPLSKALRQEIAKLIKQQAAVKETILVEEIDKAVIGGIKIETANHAWDKTLKRTLADIKEAI